MPLPFLVAPKAPTTRRIGDERVGVLEVPLHGGLSLAEGEFIADALDALESTFTLNARTAEGIATAEGVSIEEAHRLVERYCDGEELDDTAAAIAERHRIALDAAAAHSRTYFRLYRNACVVALCRYRLGATDVTVDNVTAAVAPELFAALYAIAREEQDAEPAAESTPPTAEELGKPPAASGSPRARRGAKSSTPS